MSDDEDDTGLAVNGTRQLGSSLVRRIALGLMALLATAVVMGIYFREPLTALGAYFVRELGAWGLFWGILLLDSSPFPMVNEPLLMLAVSGGLNLLWIAFAASVASVIAGGVGYVGGYALSATGLLRRLLGDRIDVGHDLLSEYGFWGLALAALTPLPFAICTWTAGALRMNLAPFALACCFRIPKVLFYLWIIFEGWTLGG